MEAVRKVDELILAAYCKMFLGTSWAMIAEEAGPAKDLIAPEQKMMR
jgi:hypothetical protein